MEGVLELSIARLIEVLFPLCVCEAYQADV
jgi:hypothetical protein